MALPAHSLDRNNVPLGPLGERLGETQLRQVLRWRQSDPRTRGAREPWRWEEHGLALGSPREQELPIWSRAAARQREAEQKAAALLRGASPAEIADDLGEVYPEYDTASMRRAASYCGCSRRRLEDFIEAHEAGVDEGEWRRPGDPRDPHEKEVAEFGFEQEELLSTGRYVRDRNPPWSPTRRKRKAELRARYSSRPGQDTNTAVGDEVEGASGEDEDVHQQEEEDDGDGGSAAEEEVADLTQELTDDAGTLCINSKGEPESFRGRKSPKYAQSQDAGRKSPQAKERAPKRVPSPARVRRAPTQADVEALYYTDVSRPVGSTEPAGQQQSSTVQELLRKPRPTALVAGTQVRQRCPICPACPLRQVAAIGHVSVLFLSPESALDTRGLPRRKPHACFKLYICRALTRGRRCFRCVLRWRRLCTTASCSRRRSWPNSAQLERRRKRTRKPRLRRRRTTILAAIREPSSAWKGGGCRKLTRRQATRTIPQTVRSARQGRLRVRGGVTAG